MVAELLGRSEDDRPEFIVSRCSKQEMAKRLLLCHDLGRGYLLPRSKSHPEFVHEAAIEIRALQLELCHPNVMKAERRDGVVATDVLLHPSWVCVDLAEIVKSKPPFVPEEVWPHALLVREHGELATERDIDV